MARRANRLLCPTMWCSAIPLTASGGLCTRGSRWYAVDHGSAARKREYRTAVVHGIEPPAGVVDPLVVRLPLSACLRYLLTVNSRAVRQLPPKHRSPQLLGDVWRATGSPSS